MQSIKDISKRTAHLDKTLIWEDLGDNYILVSSDTSRRLANIKTTAAGYATYESSHSDRPSNHYGSLEKAQEFVKFTVIKDILVEELRRQYLQ